jgi:hypothetical protein
MNEDTEPRIRSLEDNSRLIFAGSARNFRDLLDHNSDAALFFAHVGPSMNPTLSALDLLEIVPYDGKRIRIGDVVAFISPDKVYPVVHRVVGVIPEGIRTRGDNNSNNDAQFLQPEDIVGRVVAAQRGQKRRRIAGGRFGLLVVYLTRWRFALDRGISRLLHPIYRLLARCGIIRCLLPIRFRPRVIISRVSGCSYPRLLMGNRIVGQYDAHQCQWHIRRPFRLFVDESALPGNLGNSGGPASAT